MVRGYRKAVQDQRIFCSSGFKTEDGFDGEYRVTRNFRPQQNRPVVVSALWSTMLEFLEHRTSAKFRVQKAAATTDRRSSRFARNQGNPARERSASPRASRVR